MRRLIPAMLSSSIVISNVAFAAGVSSVGVPPSASMGAALRMQRPEPQATNYTYSGAALVGRTIAIPGVHHSCFLTGIVNNNDDNDGGYYQYRVHGIENSAWYVTHRTGGGVTTNYGAPEQVWVRCLDW